MDFHLSEYSLYSKYQSAYRQYHSVESALLKVQNDIMLSLDNHKEVILVTLDLSAAFDTIDHSTLLERLHTRFGLEGTVLEWFRSYLEGRSQRVMIKSEFSQPTALACGVPQGSILGPLLFTLYCTPIDDIIERHKLDYMLYADDTQLYFSCKEASLAKDRLEKCLGEIRDWMTLNKLILNDNKTKLIHFHSRFRPCNIVSSLSVGNDRVLPCKVIKNLGFWFDDEAVLSRHVSEVCSSVSFSLYRIRRIRNILDRSTTEKLVHAFVTSRLDFCNSLLYGLMPGTLLARFQRLQNSAARLITRTRFHDHITPVLKTLHWLPVTARIEFKILL
ncbi:RNA-directed DNA polymerase, partial [Fusobacterium polymorphum]